MLKFCFQEVKTLTEQVIKLVYIQSGTNRSIADLLLQQFGELKIRILGSGSNSIKNWFDLQVIGKIGLIEAAIDWLRTQDIEVQVLSS
jgi:hypothetical protein